MTCAYLFELVEMEGLIPNNSVMMGFLLLEMDAVLIVQSNQVINVIGTLIQQDLIKRHIVPILKP
jgi:hypothetical protein